MAWYFKKISIEVQVDKSQFTNPIPANIHFLVHDILQQTHKLGLIYTWYFIDVSYLLDVDQSILLVSIFFLILIRVPRLLTEDPLKMWPEIRDREISSLRW